MIIKVGEWFPRVDKNLWFMNLRANWQVDVSAGGRGCMVSVGMTLCGK
ncbi:MAG: hypothetical protein HDR29_01470 [Lachnospiraceae bacterium]|nr:hypothetical protein [Lachnospiraceae bacterium]